MKANELRIGNYVHHNHSIGMKLLAQIECGKDIDMCDELEPIPLTEEWLLKLGFNKEYKEGYIGIDFGNTDFVLSTPDNKDNNTGRYAWFFRQGRVPMFKVFYFVHELQNLYFALTGEELTLNK